jgi:hypothetical protein
MVSGAPDLSWKDKGSNLDFRLIVSGKIGKRLRLKWFNKVGLK